MIDSDDLSALRTLVSSLQDDLIAQSEQDDEVAADLEARHTEQQAKDRTADSFAAWRERFTEQVAVAWVLTTIFVRYLEDNGLVDVARIAGPKDRQREIEDQWRQFLAEREAPSEADYLLHIFGEFADMPAGELFGPERNFLYEMPISGDAARELLEFFRQTDPDTGELRYTYDRPEGRTRFLGDLYQELSEQAKSRYALLQTPEFVEEFILDKTLDPAIDTFGLQDDFRFIDPTCGSGHFLLGGFRRLNRRLAERYPALERSKRVRRALEAVHGVDINPFAVSISRFRLLVAALHALTDPDETPRLADAPNLPLQVATGDTLILGRQFTQRWKEDTDLLGTQGSLDQFRLEAAGETTEDYDLIYGDPQTGDPGILTQQYHAVVGNPPYITVKDKAANSNYRDYYESCYYQYSLVCPFYERFFDLAGGPARSTEQGEMKLGGDDRREDWSAARAGYVGMIVGNSFMKRTFGRKLIEDIIEQTDLTRVIDTSGAYIPGHGTPTVILTGRNRDPQSERVRAALGIQGEPSVPEDPAQARVWTTIRDHIDELEFENDFLTVDDVERELFEEHPWSLRGGGVLEAKSLMETCSECELSEESDAIGRAFMTNADMIYLAPNGTFLRKGVAREFVRTAGVGVDVRAWTVAESQDCLFPYKEDLSLICEDLGHPVLKYLWPFRSHLWLRNEPGGTHREIGLTWYEWSRLQEGRINAEFTLPYAEIATHNHFALSSSPNLFKRTAPVIKLAEAATEEDHLVLLGPLNSSAGCFWMKQVFFAKGGDKMGDGGRRAVEKWHDRYQRDGTKMKTFPLPDERPADLPRRLDALGQRMAELQPSSVAETGVPTADELDAAREERADVLGQMIALQEELDWQFYGIYGLSEEPPGAADFHADRISDGGDRQTALDDLPRVELGERPFEIVLARKMEAGDVDTSWFERHGSTPRTDIPDRWPDWYRELVQARIDRIDGEDDVRERFVKLIEAPEFKRRWNLDNWEDLEEEALEGWLKDRLETERYFPHAPDAVTLTQADQEELDRPTDARPQLTTVAKIAHEARADDQFRAVARRYTGEPAVDVEKLVEELVMEQAVPFLPAQRYTDSGRDRRREWEQVWDLQRQEDAIDARTELDPSDPDYLTEDEAEALKAERVGDIPKPPKYRVKDYALRKVYDIRSKLDVPKERFTSYPGLEGEDGSPHVSWAGLDHAQRAEALASFYYNARNQRGWDPDRLLPILAGLKDLQPWLNQWHDQPNPTRGQSIADFTANLLGSQPEELGFSEADLEEARLGG